MPCEIKLLLLLSLKYQKGGQQVFISLWLVMVQNLRSYFQPIAREYNIQCIHLFSCYLNIKNICLVFYINQCIVLTCKAIL